MLKYDGCESIGKVNSHRTQTQENIMTSIFQTELQTFEAHVSELLVDNAGKFALIKGDRLVDVFDTNLMRFDKAIKNLEMSPFWLSKLP